MAIIDLDRELFVFNNGLEKVLQIDLVNRKIITKSSILNIKDSILVHDVENLDKIVEE